MYQKKYEWSQNDKEKYIHINRIIGRDCDHCYSCCYAAAGIEHGKGAGPDIILQK